MLSSNQGEQAEAIDATEIFAVEINPFQRIKVLDLTAETHFEITAVKSFNRRHTASAGAYGTPDVVHATSQRRYQTEPRDYNSTA
jgi:hypothetical protein